MLVLIEVLNTCVKVLHTSEKAIFRKQSCIYAIVAKLFLSLILKVAAWINLLIFALKSSIFPPLLIPISIDRRIFEQEEMSAANFLPMKQENLFILF